MNRGEGLCLKERSLILEEETPIDAGIIDAPSSAKNRDRKRDPDMHRS